MPTEFFANQWKIFRYHVDLYDLKKYSIGNELPYAPEIDVHRIDTRTENERRTSASVPVTLTKGKRYAPSLRVEFSAKQWTVGLDPSSWQILAQAFVKNAYLTKD